MSKPGKPGRQRRKYWLKRREEGFNPRLYMKRLSRNRHFRRFLVLFLDLASEGTIYTAAGLHSYCRDDRQKISLSTVYNYLKYLDRLGLVAVRSDGSKSFFKLLMEEERLLELIDFVNEEIEKANYIKQRRRVRRL